MDFWEELTEIYRERRVEDLEPLLAETIAGEHYDDDERYVMMSLAPIHHCATQLGVDVPALFDRVAVTAPPEYRSLMRTFGRRTDTGPRYWTYRIVHTPDGPIYRS